MKRLLRGAGWGSEHTCPISNRTRAVGMLRRLTDVWETVPKPIIGNNILVCKFPSTQE